MINLFQNNLSIKSTNLSSETPLANIEGMDKFKNRARSKPVNVPLMNSENISEYKVTYLNF